MRAQATQLNASVLSGGTRPHRARRQHSKRERPFLWFAPVILLLLAVTLYPTALVIWISFQKTRFYALGLPLYPLDRTGVRMSGAVAGSTRGLPVAGTVAVLFTALVLVPVLWGISTSFKNEVDAVQVPPQLLPAPATASNYIQVLSNPNFLTQVAEMAATGAMLPLEDLIARDNLSTTDWLLPLDANRIGGHLYSLPQDYRIPILIYRKSLLEQAHVTPPRTWDELCADGPHFTQRGIIPFAVPVGATGDWGAHRDLANFS
jgi:Bacterial extracellular solute-binding protein